MFNKKKLQCKDITIFLNKKNNFTRFYSGIFGYFYKNLNKFVLI